jgi:hypothetical protein
MPVSGGDLHRQQEAYRLGTPPVEVKRRGHPGSRQFGIQVLWRECDLGTRASAQGGLPMLHDHLSPVRARFKYRQAERTLLSA